MLKGVAAENKLKIVWICGFSNEHIRSELNLVANPFIVKLRKLFGKADKHFYSDFGAWITALIEEFKKMPDVELHIITGHNGMKRLYQEFSIEGIHYHIFKQDLPFIHYLPKNRYCLGLNPKILAARHFTNKFIQKIKPDIVHLYGAEGIVKSIPALDVKNVPVLVALQTVYSDPQLSAFIKPNKLRLKTEIRVHQRMKYFGTGSPYYRDIVLSRNPKAYIFRFVFPTLRPKTISNARKKYDFVFYATTLSEVKGAPDSIEALAVVKKHKNDVSLNLVGNATNEMMNKLKKLVNSLGLSSNVEFTPFFERQADMHRHIQQAYIALLPVKMDLIPTTIREALFLGLPVITYKTSGTPRLNEKRQTVLIAATGDVQGLAVNMIKLMENLELRNSLISNGYLLAEERFSSNNIAKGLLENYLAIKDHYFCNITIPKSMLIC